MYANNLSHCKCQLSSFLGPPSGLLCTGAGCSSAVDKECAGSWLAGKVAKLPGFTWSSLISIYLFKSDKSDKTIKVVVATIIFLLTFNDLTLHVASRIW